MESKELAQLASDNFDYRDGTLIRLKSTGGQKAGDRAGTLHRDGYRRIMIKRKSYLEHRIIYLMHNPNWDITKLSQQIDHINRDRDDNRIENLRLVTHQENQFNQNARGYSYCKRVKKYRAYITIDGKDINLGNFDYATDARLARVTAEKIHHIIEDRK